MTQTDCLSYTDISKSWNRRFILRDVRLKICRGQFTVLCGENGSGKTTLLKILSGLLNPDSGLVQGPGLPIRWKQARTMLLKRTLYMHQTPYMFSGTVYRNLSIATGHIANNPKKKQRIEEALEWVQLERFCHEPANVLSGGQKQRIALARAWLKGSHFLFLDEPTANMDNRSVERTLELLHSLKQSGCAIMVCTHIPSIFDGLADQMLMATGSSVQAANFSTPSGESVPSDPSRQAFI